MRLTILLAVLLLSGCGTMTPLEELERQAMLTGDWSEVEKRERLIRLREARRGPRCSDGLVGYCESSFGKERCTCVASAMVRDTFEGIY